MFFKKDDGNKWEHIGKLTTKSFSILLKMYWKTSSNTSSNVMKISTHKNGAKYP